MKKNAILVAGIMFIAAGCASQGSYRAGTDSGPYYNAGLSTFDTADTTTMSGTEVIQRDSRGHMMPHTPTDPTHQYSLEASGSSSANVGELTLGGDTPATFSDDDRDTDMSPENVEAMLNQDEIIAESSAETSSTEAESWSDAGGERESVGGFSGAESGEASSSIEGSANWGDDNFNPSTSFDNDGIEESSGSLSGAANIYSNPGSEAVVEDNLYHGSAQTSEGSELEAETSVEADLNASGNLEENIAGDFNLEERLDSETQSELEGSPTSLQSSTTTGEITHGPESGPGSPGEMEAAGAAAGSESGSQSSESEADNSSELDSLGSAESSDSSGTPAQSGSGSDQSTSELAQEVKSTLVNESTGTHGLMRHEITRNIQVSAEGDVVTLKGSVPSEQDKQIVEIRAREVSGVREVENQLTVTPESDPANRDLSKGHDLEEQTDQLKD